MRILLIERDSVTAAAIELMLKAEDFNVYMTDDGTEGTDLAKLYDYDAIVASELDVAPIRNAGVKTPILVVSHDPSIETKVKSLSAGADDYLTKPFHKDEFIARLQVAIRRSRGHAHRIVRAGDLALDINAKSVTVAGEPVHLSGKEYQVLELLAFRKGTVISKDNILDHLYGGMDEPEIKIIDVFICKLRKKIGLHRIETVWGRGYLIPDPIPEVESPPTVPTDEPATMEAFTQ
jgi:two-component system cell cycle response regulator CtrA